ncbi:MAG: hypothetical protein F6J98_34560 [Moorea sp. SIO4G2]|uniref:hypothetical protein n=1 Tax=unclassified Moorena TaxID=2683338 RepID=UPI0013FA87C4|nr:MULTISPECIES: hypothetical protein [unclassified Moorena]NEO16608.1 hypothetical protein [Moorena sp. SIO3E8]NEO65241.1 hypothetical protein [Moorena sp. SIO4G2]NEP27668.1 hypothetical protein [Moorena sp. SIO3I6]NEQ03292.1 hypothetical protein [Moorena sp. SIO3F7]
MIGFVMGLTLGQKYSTRLLIFVQNHLKNVSIQRSVVSGQWSAVSSQRSVVSGQWSVVTSHWSVVSGHWSVVSSQLIAPQVAMQRVAHRLITYSKTIALY